MDVADELTIREAEGADHEAVQAITADTWPDREGQDYLGRVYPRWLEAGDRPKRTLVADDDGTAVAIAQCVLLTDHEAWGQGLRVHPEYRNRGLSRRLTAELFAWAIDHGATVMRAIVHAWNEAGLGQARAAGYRPAGSFRWVYPAVDDDAPATAHLESTPRPWLDAPPTATIESDPAMAWRAFHRSDGARVLGGMGMSLDESWAATEVTDAALERTAEETAVFAVRTDVGTTAMSYRSRTFDQSTADDSAETVAEYGAAVWQDTGSAAVLLDAISADATRIDADRIRVAVPDRPRYVSDAARCRASVADSAEVIMAADLTAAAAVSALRDVN